MGHYLGLSFSGPYLPLAKPMHGWYPSVLPAKIESAATVENIIDSATLLLAKINDVAIKSSDMAQVP